jgi:hypothetical protein
MCPQFSPTSQETLGQQAQSSETKRLLLIGLRYHAYTSGIAAEFEQMGFAVTYHEVQPRSLLFQLARRLWPSLYRRMLDHHHRAIIAAEQNRQYDFVVFIQAHQVSIENLQTLRRQHAGARFVLYNWDSIYTHDYRPVMHVFDRVFTFDKADASALGIGYLPLFCLRSLQAMRTVPPSQGAVYCIGNVATAPRYLAVRAFAAYCRANGIPFYTHMTCSVYAFYLLLRQGIFPRGVTFLPISRKRAHDMIARSVAVFDFANHRQSGYTMRLIENLCMDRKIITNNENVLQEAFYSPDRIYTYRDLDFSGVKAFLARKLEGGVDAIEAYHIQNFVRRLID